VSDRKPGGWPTAWVRNLQANARVTVELGGASHAGLACALEAGAAEDHLARALVLAKYSGSEDNLDEWGRTSLAVVVAFPAEIG
jgi:F420H(2)-dependent quinone reductase